MSIAIAGIEDAQVISELSIYTFIESFGANNTKEDIDLYVAEELNVERIASELTDNDNFFFLASVNEKAVGFAKVRVAANPDAPAGRLPIELNRLYVSREFQGQKIGAGLMAHCIAFGRERGHDVIWLGVWEYNYSSLAFYKSWGYEPYSSHGFRLGRDPQTDILMKKAIE